MQTIIKANETFKGKKIKENLWRMLPIDEGYNQQHDRWNKFFKGCKTNFDTICFRQQDSTRFKSNFYDEKTGYFELSGADDINSQPKTDESYVNDDNKKEAFFMHKTLKNGEKEYKFIGIFEKRAYIKSMNKYIFIKVADDLICEL